MLNTQTVLEWLSRAGELMAENREYLTELDAEIGDADHGINMDRGFKKVISQLPSMADMDIGNILKSTGLALISTIGGASGPLYGTMFMRAGTLTAGKKELDTTGLTKALAEGLTGIMERGRAQEGEKTMVDSLAPAIAAMKHATETGKGAGEALRDAVSAAEKGMNATISMKAKRGRASYLGERSIGHQDPGATSSYLLLKALCDAVNR
jgi:dihydroxyacetone kinase-like protein